MDDLRGELESRREAHAEALTSQRQRLVEEHQEELQSILKSREVELQKKLDDQAEVAKREASSRREAEEVRMFRLPLMVAGLFIVLESHMRKTNTSASSLKFISTKSCRITGFLRKYFNLDRTTVVFADFDVQNHLVVPAGCVNGKSMYT